ncbi:MBL fold metallo-hydrolase [Sporolactobacillus shoreicorticis]|uniref:MBL fold metallo-hydrolase n=1 Tax=Sporolactobacillus shoreicorticis TaxID=1923877 RepID=A0ABW5S5G6_9BACL|nr:MBL fold metallo-hydrolase [Sporolactobacillus shoreicorticis]MCO7124377.1 MBL fold metallo-hydrolase [Sporolactobacillus shoreicorticis]
MSNSDWFTVEKIDTHTYAISEYGHWEHVHAYLLIGRKQAALIDTGIGIGDISFVVEQLTQLPVIVLTTHVHWDHIGGHGLFKKIYVHKKEKSWLENGIPGLSIKQIRKDVFKDLTKPIPSSVRPESYYPFKGKPTGVFQDMDVFELGTRKLNVIDTPGHSPGHVCFYDESTGYLFSGDLIYTGTPIYAFYPSTDPLELVKSFKKVAHLEKEVSKVFGGHNEMGLDASILHEAGLDAEWLIQHDLVKFGTGTHHFQRLSVQF